jgi:hypothetical protein
MAEMPLGAEQHEIAEVTQRLGRRVDEIGEARVGRPHEPQITRAKTSAPTA